MQQEELGAFGRWFSTDQLTNSDDVSWFWNGERWYFHIVTSEELLLMLVMDLDSQNPEKKSAL